MLQPLDEHMRDISNIARRSPHEIVFEHAENFVVRVTAVDHLKSADDAAADEDLVSCDGTLAQHADVERVAIALLCSRRQLADTIAAIRSRNETVQRRRQR